MRDRDERLQAIFRGVFSLPGAADVSRCRQVSMPEWDSLAHVTLVAAMCDGHPSEIADAWGKAARNTVFALYAARLLAS